MTRDSSRSTCGGCPGSVLTIREAAIADQNLGAYNIADLREIALRRVPKGVFEFVDRGAEDEVALRNNRAAFERIKLRPRTLVDVSGRRQDITLFGNQQKMPIAIAPTGTAGLMWHEGEIALARAAAESGMALIGCRSVAELGPKYLHFADPALRAAGPAKPALKLLESSRAVAGG